MKRVRLSRRAFLALPALASQFPRGQAQEVANQATPEKTLEELMAGNRRFVSGRSQNPRRTPADFARLAHGQAPEAVIVGCSDSRVSPEIVFDQGVGDLFVIRVAGNVVSGAGPAVKGSIAYAVVELGAPLVIILGHSDCGAVKAALAAKAKPLPQSIIDLVGLVQTGSQSDLDQAILANVQAGVARLRELEPNIARFVATHQLKLVGAVYDLASGRVTLVA